MREGTMANSTNPDATPFGNQTYAKGTVLLAALVAFVLSHAVLVPVCHGEDSTAEVSVLCTSEIDEMIDAYEGPAERNRCRLLTFFLSFSQPRPGSDSLSISVALSPRLPDRFTMYRTWVCLPHTVGAPSEQPVWEGTFERPGISTFDVGPVATSAGIHQIKAYVLAKYTSGELVPCRCEYWVKTGTDTMLVSADSTFEEPNPVQFAYGSEEGAADTGPADSTGALSGWDIYPTVIAKATPEYPMEARRAGTEGAVLVMVVIDENGKVIKAWVEYSDNAVFDQSALDAAFKFQFTSAKQRGVPVKATITIPFRFYLED
jgi:TonB family protein